MSRDILDRPFVPPDRRVPYGADANQFFDVFLPATPEARATAIMIHGGFWRSFRDLRPSSHLCAALAKNGIVTANIEYRRTGETGGGWPATFDDVVAAFHAVRREIPSAPPVVVGHSAGGHLALRLAGETTSIAGVLALAPVSDLALAHQLDLGNGAVIEFLGNDASAMAAACASTHASPVPRTLLFGTADDFVPISCGRAFVKARKGDDGPVKLIEIPGADHFDVIDPESAAFPLVLACVLEFLER
jgi:acetyl esterase/lipase